MAFCRRVQVLVVAAVTFGAALAGAGSAASAAPSPAQVSAAQRWYQQVVSDLRPLQTSLLDSLRAASGWQQGSESAGAARGVIAGDLPKLVAVQRRLQGLAPLAGHTGARADYVDGVGLYVDAFRVEEIATQTSGAALVAQLRRSYARIRELGDETFDQGTAQLAPLLGTSIAGTDVAAASHIPDWSSLGLAPGEPLVASWSAAPQADGPASQSTWDAAVRSDGAPAQSSLRAVLTARTKNTAALSRLALALNRAEVALSSVTVPLADASSSALLRLGLLTDAEAVLAADAASQKGGKSPSALLGVAQSLLAAGASLRTEAAAAG